MIDLKDIRQRLEGELEDARFSAWMELFTEDTEAASSELERVIHGSDPVLKILYLRFLAHALGEKSVRHIATLMGQENTVVFEAAQKAFKVNRTPAKATWLAPLIHSAPLRTRQFVIETLGVTADLRWLGPLLTCLAGAEAELVPSLLTALRHLPDRRLLEVIRPFLTSQDPQVRFKAVLVLGSVFEARMLYSAGILLAMLADPEPSIRQTVIWILRKRPKRRHLPYLLTRSRQDDDVMVRQECVQALGAFPQPTVVAHLLELAVLDSSRIVRLKSQAVLVGLAAHRLGAGLKRCLKHPRPDVRDRALIMLVQFGPTPQHYFNRLVKRLGQTASVREKIVVLQALGWVENRSSREVLESYLHGDVVLAYAAMTSLYRLYNAKDQGRILALVADSDLSPVIRQIALKALLIRVQAQDLDDQALALVATGLTDATDNVRYYASLVIAAAARPALMTTVFEGLRRESHAGAHAALVEYVQKLVLADLSTYLDRIAAVPEYWQMGLDLIPVARLSPAQFWLLADRLLSLQNEARAKTWGILVDILLNGGLDLEGILERLGPEEQSEFVALLLRSWHGKEAAPLTISHAVLERLRERSALAEEDLVALAGFSRDAALIPVLVQGITRPGMEKLHQKARQSLARLMNAL